jgi:hypothetical protein
VRLSLQPISSLLELRSTKLCRVRRLQQPNTSGSFPMQPARTYTLAIVTSRLYPLTHTCVMCTCCRHLVVYHVCPRTNSKWKLLFASQCHLVTVPQVLCTGGCMCCVAFYSMTLVVTVAVLLMITIVPITTLVVPVCQFSSQLLNIYFFISIINIYKHNTISGMTLWPAIYYKIVF